MATSADEGHGSKGVRVVDSGVDIGDVVLGLKGVVVPVEGLLLVTVIFGTVHDNIHAIIPFITPSRSNRNDRNTVTRTALKFILFTATAHFMLVIIIS